MMLGEEEEEEEITLVVWSGEVIIFVWLRSGFVSGRRGDAFVGVEFEKSFRKNELWDIAGCGWKDWAYELDATLFSASQMPCVFKYCPRQIFLPSSNVNCLLPENFIITRYISKHFWRAVMARKLDMLPESASPSSYPQQTWTTSNAGLLAAYF